MWRNAGVAIVQVPRENLPYSFHISPKAEFKIRLFVHLNSPMECTWLGVVQRKGNTLICEDVLFPEQEVSASTVDISASAEAKLVEELLMQYRYDDIALLRLWGHSHPNFSTTPSLVDEEQTQRFIDRMQEYFVRMIVNDDEEMHLTMYFLEEGLIVFHPNISIVGSPLSYKETEQCIDEVIEACRIRVKSCLFSCTGFLRHSSFRKKRRR